MYARWLSTSRVVISEWRVLYLLCNYKLKFRAPWLWGHAHAVDAYVEAFSPPSRQKFYLSYATRSLGISYIEFFLGARRSLVIAGINMVEWNWIFPLLVFWNFRATLNEILEGNSGTLFLFHLLLLLNLSNIWCKSMGTSQVIYTPGREALMA